MVCCSRYRCQKIHWASFSNINPGFYPFPYMFLKICLKKYWSWDGLQLFFRCLQDVRGAFKEDEPKQSVHHLWYQSVVWLYWWPGRFKLSCVSISAQEGCHVPWELRFILSLSCNRPFTHRYRADTQTYQPYNKDWIKEKIYVLLRRQAQQAGK